MNTSSKLKISMKKVKIIQANIQIRIIILIVFVLNSLYSYSQTGIIAGRVYNEINNESIPYANIYIDGTTTGVISDEQGNYRIENLLPGTYNVIGSFLGFGREIFYEVIVSPIKPTILNIPLVEESTVLTQVELQNSPFKKSIESPVSKQTIGAEEIYRNPGGNRDISKVIQILPGVASTISFRNDIIVRGGAPNENRFYLDGVEVPNINHFATQGSSGGPVGMINVNFIRNVEFYSGAFPANRGNMISSLMEFEQIIGNKEKLTGSVTLGSSDIGITLNGPTGKNSSFIFSARRSYLQYVFKVLKLPFLPTYTDFQFKESINIDEKNELSFIGLAAIDDFELNESVNDGITNEDDINRNNYILSNIPVNSQWNYTVGANYKHYSQYSNQMIVISRNHLSNKSIKYKDNIEEEENLLLDYKSEEIENKFRYENTYRKNGWKWNIGGGYEYAIYTNSTFNKTEINGEIQIVDFDSRLYLNKYSFFTHLSQTFFQDKLALSAGFRMDSNNYSKDMSNPFDQFSPRFSASYRITNKFSFNFNLGRYYQLPAYTVLGYRNNEGVLINKLNNITYINNNQIVAGLAFNPNNFSKITLEGFYKKYDNYPFLLNDSISLANLGGDFGVIGNEPAKSISKGKSYGIEFMMQQKLSTSVYGILSYTFVRSEFNDKNERPVASSWDNVHILNITAGKKLKRFWEIGAKFRLLGGSPFTPYDIELSSQKEIWDVTQRGINDWDRLNEERNGLSHGLDIRIDKKWFFNKWALNLYLDIQNIYNFKTITQPYLDVRRDDNGNPIEDPNNPNAYSTYLIENSTGTILPSIGIVVEF